jgi:hypothetical protein
MHTIQRSTATLKSQSLTENSTGSTPADWREWWRINGTTWQDIAELNVAVIERLIATSTVWSS